NHRRRAGQGQPFDERHRPESDRQPQDSSTAARMGERHRSRARTDRGRGEPEPVQRHHGANALTRTIAMGIKGKFNINAIFKDLEARLRPLIIEAVTEAFEQACLEVVEQAKSLDTYQDQTNQLRSSIGYQIYNQGVLVTEYFQASGKGDGSGSAQGVARGKTVAAEAARQYPDDVVGVIVAGAHYALY